MRLTKSHRLLRSQDFGQVFDKPGFRISARHFLILAMDSGATLPRLGLVISKKHVGCAVARNRVKRLCRETFRARLETLPALDIVIVARGGLKELENAALVAALGGLFDQLQLKAAARSSRP